MWQNRGKTGPRSKRKEVRKWKVGFYGEYGVPAVHALAILPLKVLDEYYPHHNLYPWIPVTKKNVPNAHMQQ